jgi:2-polyprenyl-3-methyl-5-hydroxy-6-metoxy-1,4-benzoquinol methylase
MPNLKYYLSNLGKIWSRPGRALDALAYPLQRRLRWGSRRVTAFWDRFASDLHQKYGRMQDDFELIARIIRDHRVGSVLDVGCGSGRLFPLYRQLQVSKVLGVDIAASALAIAEREHPGVPTRCVRLQELSLADDEFDLIISNRVLQHIAPAEIVSIIARLCKVAPLIYVNELSQSDPYGEQFFMFVHDYRRIFQEQSFVQAERGRMGLTTYLLFRRA